MRVYNRKVGKEVIDMSRNRELIDALSPLSRSIRGKECGGDCDLQCACDCSSCDGPDCSGFAGRFRSKDMLRRVRRPVRTGRIK